MGSYGTQTVASDAYGIQVIADGRTDGMKIGGITIDWSLVTALAADVTLPDGTVIKAGDSYIRYGTILAAKYTQEVITFSMAGASAGTFTLTKSGETTAAIAYNASAADVQTAIEGLASVAVGDFVVTKSTTTYTLTAKAELGDVGVWTLDGTLTTGLSSSTVTIGTPGVGSSKFGPSLTTNSDGTQTLTRGRCYILNRTVIRSQPNSDHPEVFDRGAAFMSRIVSLENVPAAANPTEANILVAFPGLTPVRN